MLAGRRTEDVDVLGVLWRHRLGLIFAMVLGAAAGAGLSQFQPVTYTAESRIFLSVATSFDPLDFRPTSGNTEQRFMVQQAALITSRPVLDRVKAPEGVDLSALGEVLDVSGSADSELLVIRATAADPAAAAALADAVPVAYQAFVREEVAQDVERAVTGAITDPEQLQEIRLAAALYDDGVAVVEQAGVPTQPSQPATVRNVVALTVLLGLAYATVVVVARTVLTRPERPIPPKARSTRDVENVRRGGPGDDPHEANRVSP